MDSSMSLEQFPKPTPLIRNRFEKVDYASGSTPVKSTLSEIDLELGQSPLGFPPEVLNKLMAELKRRPEEILNSYPTPYSEKSLAPLVIERFGLPESTRVFFNGDGSYGLLAAILSDLIDREEATGTKVIGYGPQFANIALLADRAEIPYEAVQPPLELSQAEKIRALVEHRIMNGEYPSIVYVDNPNNPTGDATGSDNLIELADVTAQNGDLLIVDEAYGDFIDDSETAMKLIEQYPHLIVLRSISKGIGLASPRLGYAVTSPEVGHYYEDVQLVFAVDGIAYVIAQQVLQPGVLEKFLPKVREETAYVKGYFIEQLELAGIKTFPTHPDVSIFMAQGPEEFYQKLKSVGINTEDGAAFRKTYDLDSSYVRIRVPKTIEEVNEALARIATIL